MPVDEKTALEQLARHGVKLPPQPRVLVELQQLLLGDDYDARSVARVIGQDPGIVALLFKAARSPAFARARNAQTLEQILMVVGIKQVFNLVQAASLATALLTWLFGDSGVALATLGMTALVLVFGEVMPKTVAITFPEPVATRPARHLGGGDRA